MYFKNDDIKTHIAMILKNQQYIILMLVTTWFLLILLTFVILIGFYDIYNNQTLFSHNECYKNTTTY